MQPQRPVTLVNTTSDTLFAGKLQLLQPAKGHRAGTDAVLLAAACPAAETIADVGSGVGTVGLRAAQMHENAQVFLIEREPALNALARQNIAANGLNARVFAQESDILNRNFRGIAETSCQVVLTNPPFDEPGTVRVSPHPGRASAHVLSISLESWTNALLKILKSDGVMIMIHRADALPRLLAATKGRFGGISVLAIHPQANRPASRILVKGKRGSKAPLRILPPLVLHRPDGAFTPEADAIHRGEALLAL